jgi:hypothetical protein
MKPTDWCEVKVGTPVLFRRSKEAEYEAGTWVGGNAYRGAAEGAFGWAVAAVSGGLSRGIGSRVAENGEWHIDPFWCKLKTDDTQAVLTHIFGDKQVPQPMCEGCNISNCKGCGEC